MPRKILSHKKQSTIPAPAPESGPAPAPAKFTPRGGAYKNRLLVAVADGKIDFAAMSPEMGKQLNELLHTPEVQAQFGIGPLTSGFNPQHCKRIYEALGLVLMGFGKFAFHWPSSALEKLAYTESEKEELAEPTAAVLDELAPRWLRENQALAALVLVLTAMTQNKMREAAMEAARVKAQGGGGGGAVAGTRENGRVIPIPIVSQQAPIVDKAAN